MIAVDTNVLVYAIRPESPQYAAAHRTVTQLSDGSVPWGLPFQVIVEFLRVVTHPRSRPPLPPAQAMWYVDGLVSSPSVRIIGPGARTVDVLAQVIEDGGAAGNVMHDAALVAVCIENGIDEIISEDRDLRRFTGIRVRRLDEGLARERAPRYRTTKKSTPKKSSADTMRAR